MATEPKILPLVEQLGQRYQSLTVDSKLVNALAEQGQAQGEWFVYKRPAFNLQYSVTAGTARGLFNWNGDIYAIVGGTIYKNGASLGAVNAAGTYSFAPTLGATPKLFFHNGTNAYTVTAAGALAAVTDVHYPASTVFGSAYLDATTYVMDASGNIYGCTAASNDPTTWDPLNLIKAQIEPTTAVALTKQLVYILALKQGYSEVFYDAGNSTGSPLAAAQGMKLNFGCVDAGTLRDVGGDLMWLAESGEGGPCVLYVSGLKAEVVSIPQVERLFATAGGSYFSWNARVEGHRLYGVSSVGGNFTFVYDLTSKVWYQWADTNGNYLPYAFSCRGAGLGGNTYFLHATNGGVYTLDPTIYKDGTDSPFTLQIQTPNFDGGTRKTKACARMDFLADQVNTNVTVSWTDDDYQTFQGGFPVAMGNDRPILEGLGSFTKRAFSFVHQDNTPFRLKAVELYLDVSSS